MTQDWVTELGDVNSGISDGRSRSCWTRICRDLSQTPVVIAKGTGICWGRNSRMDLHPSTEYNINLQFLWVWWLQGSCTNQWTNHMQQQNSSIALGGQFHCDWVNWYRLSSLNSFCVSVTRVVVGGFRLRHLSLLGERSWQNLHVVLGHHTLLELQTKSYHTL